MPDPTNRASTRAVDLAGSQLDGMRQALSDAPAAWAVGGTVRDLLLGRHLTDIDLAIDGSAQTVAKRIHGAFGGDVFRLSERFGTWRVQPAAGDLTIDLTPLRGDSIDHDLKQRDFTVNAMAIRLTDQQVRLIDPFNGHADLTDSIIRVCGEQAYRDDSLRPLRAARLAATLDFSVDPETATLTRNHAPEVTGAAPERVFAELRKLIGADDPLRGVRLLDELGLMRVVLPELSNLQGVEQSVYHHLDAFEHTLEVLRMLLQVESQLPAIFGDDAELLVGVLEQPLADEMTRSQALRWAALLHDIAKAETRTVWPDGRVGFPGHDVRGGAISRQITRRLNASERFSQYVSALTVNHLRLGFLVDQAPIGRGSVYDYLKACEPVEVEVGVLSVADRMATRGRKSDVAIERHVSLARELNRAALDWRIEWPSTPLIRGDELAAAIGIEPGPQLGNLLGVIERARYCGEINDRDAAIALARSQLPRLSDAAG